MADRNLIAQELTVEQLDRFIKELAALPGKERTLKAIAEKAQKLGINISLMSAKAFRDTTFKRHLNRLQKAQELATQVAAMQQQGAGNTLADASAAILSQQIFDLLEESEDLNLKDAGKYAFIISKIRQGDVATRRFQFDKEKFAVAHCETFIKWSKNKRAQEIVNSNINNAEKIKALRTEFFKDIDELEKSGAIQLPT